MKQTNRIVFAVCAESRIVISLERRGSLRRSVPLKRRSRLLELIREPSFSKIPIPLQSGDRNVKGLRRFRFAQAPKEA